MRTVKFLVYLCFPLCLWSCASKLVTKSVGYQSIRTTYAQPTPSSPIPDEAKIAVAYTLSSTGGLTAIVYNRTSEIMTIDQTLSFFVDSDGKSTSYYDPTIRTTSKTDLSSKTKGGSVNLGSIAGALGIGGFVGKVADGINVGGSGTTGTSITNATYVADQPKVSLAPHSNGAMSKVFNVTGVGEGAFQYGNMISPTLTEKESYCHFSVCISYSVDGGNTFEKLITNFYADSKVIIPVNTHGRVNEALSKLYQTKPDALYEPWWILYFNHNVPYSPKSYLQGIIYDYQ